MFRYVLGFLISLVVSLFVQSMIFAADDLGFNYDPQKVCSNIDELKPFSTLENSQTARQATRYSDIATVQSDYLANKILLLDVRDKSEYEEFRIPRAVHVPLHQLKYKSYLKKKSLVLVGSGKQYKTLEQTFSDLQEEGFEDISILDGGIRAWFETMGLVDGKKSEARRLNLLSVKDFITEAQHGPWLIIDVDENKEFTHKVNGEVLHIPLNTSFKKNLLKQLDQKEINPMTRMLFVSNNRNIYKNIAPELSDLPLNNHYILSQVTDFIDIYKNKNLLAMSNRKKKISGCDL